MAEKATGTGCAAMFALHHAEYRCLDTLRIIFISISTENGLRLLTGLKVAEGGPGQVWQLSCQKVFIFNYKVERRLRIQRGYLAENAAGKDLKHSIVQRMGKGQIQVSMNYKSQHQKDIKVEPEQMKLMSSF